MILNHYLILVHQFNVNIYADMVFSNFLNRRTVCGRKCVITYRVYRTAEYQMIFELFTHYSCQEMRVENEIWTNFKLLSKCNPNTLVRWIHIQYCQSVHPSCCSAVSGCRSLDICTVRTVWPSPSLPHWQDWPAWSPQWWRRGTGPDSLLCPPSPYWRSPAPQQSRASSSR